MRVVGRGQHAHATQYPCVDAQLLCVAGNKSCAWMFPWGWWSCWRRALAPAPCAWTRANRLSWERPNRLPVDVLAHLSTCKVPDTANMSFIYVSLSLGRAGCHGKSMRACTYQFAASLLPPIAWEGLKVHTLACLYYRVNGRRAALVRRRRYIRAYWFWGIGLN